MWPTTQEGKIIKMQKPPSQIKLECRDSAGSTPLILAALKGHLEAVECLIAYGANVNAKDSNG